MAKPKIPADPNLGKNLQFLMGEKFKLRNQTQVAAKVGMSQSSIGRILRGEVNPSAAALSRIAEAFEVEVGDLYLDHNVFAGKHMSEHTRSLNEFKKASDNFFGTIDRIAQGMVPLITWEQAKSNKVPKDTKWVTCPAPHSLQTYALDVKGLSMFDPASSMSFQEGDTIFVDQKVPPTHRSIVVARIGNSDEASLRQLIADGGRWLLLQLNPSWPNRVIPLAEEDAILGTVIAKLQILVAPDSADTGDRLVIHAHSPTSPE